MFSSHIDMIYKNSALQGIFVRKITVYRVQALQEDILYMRKWWVSTFQQIVGFNSNFRIYYKGGTASGIFL